MTYNYVNKTFSTKLKLFKIMNVGASIDNVIFYKYNMWEHRTNNI